MISNETNLLLWKRGEPDFQWGGRRFETIQPLLSVCLLPDNKGVAFVIRFDEQTLPEEPNVFVVQQQEKIKPVLVHDDDGRLVRMIGCYSSNKTLILKGANSFEYLLEMDSLTILEKRYYR
jgi:hypothetical protein